MQIEINFILGNNGSHTPSSLGGSQADKILAVYKILKV